MQAFVELGFESAIIFVASHEWAKLRYGETGEIVGDANALSRLVSLGHFAFRFFVVAAVLFGVTVGSVGYVFFLQHPAADVDWPAPWAALVAFTAGSIALIPFTALLRGCQQMAAVNRFLSAQAITGNLAIWASILLGANLWSAVAVAAVKLFWEAALVFRFRSFFLPFWNKPPAERMQWKTEVLPLQWRLAVQGMFGFFAASLMAPVIFHYHGPAEAGRIGMTWTALMTLQYSAIAWVWARVAQFGLLVSERNFAELDRVFNRVTTVSFCLLALAGAMVVACVSSISAIANGAAWASQLPDIVQLLATRLSQRIAEPWPTLLLTVAVVLNHIPLSLAIYLRAHKRDPLLALNVFSSAAIGLLVWLLGSRFGISGAAWGYLAVAALVSVPGSLIVFLRSRREWH
jgi:hypothetical protein